MVIALCLLLLGVILYAYYSSDRYSWFESYEYEDSNPYGGMVLSRILEKKGESSGYTTVTDTLSKVINTDSLEGNANYVFLGQHQFLDSLEISFLLDFVDKGNKAFIFSKSLNSIFMDTLLVTDTYIDWEIYSEESEGAWWFNESNEFIQSHQDSVIIANLVTDGDSLLNPGYRVRWVRENEPYNHNWFYFKHSLEPRYTDTLEVLGYFDGKRKNYIKLPFGDGAFYFHTNPELFTNFFLKEKRGFEYCNLALEEMNDGHIYWDRVNRFYQPSKGNESANNSELYDAEDGPLSFILGDPKLRAAWYTLLGTALLFLLLGVRRTQRVVPVTSKNENTSIEYSETVGQLYMRQGNHRPLGLLKMKLFLAYIREHYGLNTRIKSADDIESLIKRLTLKSDVNENTVRKIFDLHRAIENTQQVSTELLVRFHRALEHFYNTCK